MSLIKRYLFTLTGVLLCSSFINLAAATDNQSHPVDTSLVDERTKIAIKTALTNLNSAIQIDSITSTPITGIYEVILGSGDFLYTTSTGNYFFSGSLFNLQKSKPLINITELAKQDFRAKLIHSAPTQQAWVFSPKSEVKASISVFTDVDCFYCQKLHAEIEDINKLGIEVRYLAFPRAGINSSSHQVLANAWCADDANGYFTLAKALASDKKRPPFPSTQCDNPVASHYNLGQKMGINATPAIVLDDGTLWPGYFPAKMLAERLGIN